MAVQAYQPLRHSVHVDGRLKKNGGHGCGFADISVPRRFPRNIMRNAEKNHSPNEMTDVIHEILPDTRIEVCY